MDNYAVKFSGSAELPTPLDPDKNYMIAGEWEQVSYTGNDLKNGDTLLTYNLAPVRLMQVDEAGEKIRLQTKNPNSVRIRAAASREQAKRPRPLNAGQVPYY